jgi:hypothetical protein
MRRKLRPALERVRLHTLHSGPNSLDVIPAFASVWVSRDVGAMRVCRWWQIDVIYSSAVFERSPY